MSQAGQKIKITDSISVLVIDLFLPSSVLESCTFVKLVQETDSCGGGGANTFLRFLIAIIILSFRKPNLYHCYYQHSIPLSGTVCRNFHAHILL